MFPPGGSLLQTYPGLVNVLNADLGLEICLQPYETDMWVSLCQTRSYRKQDHMGCVLVKVRHPCYTKQQRVMGFV